MLNHSIRGPLTSFISLEFYCWIDRGGSSSTADVFISIRMLKKGKNKHIF
jgi:hypothetical protein